MVNVASGFGFPHVNDADEVASATKRGRRVAAPRHAYEEEYEYTDDHGNTRSRTAEKMEVTCARCGNRAVVNGHEDDSYRAACVMLRNTCPKAEANFYAEP